MKGWLLNEIIVDDKKSKTKHQKCDPTLRQGGLRQDDKDGLINLFNLSVHFKIK